MKDQLPAGTKLSHYRILSLIGAGGMGEVYLAHDAELDRSVALKILPSELTGNRKRMQRFIQEAKLASALNHPNICVIHEVDNTDEGRPFIIMEHIEGTTLDAMIGSRSLDAAKIIDIGIQAADALVEAHSKRIVHRDIKPANIMITTRGQAKVLDFGLAKLTKPAKQALASDVDTLAGTDPGAVIGTVLYMSPEQALGQETDHRSDIFSLGVVLYEMAAGRRPFWGAVASEVIHQIAHAQPEAVGRFNSNAPAELERITLKCLEKDRERRYQSARELMVDLKNLKRDIDSGARIIEKAVPKNEPELYDALASPVKPASKPLLYARRAMLFVAAIALAALAWLFLFRPSKQDGSDSLSSIKFVQLHSWKSKPGDPDSDPRFSPDGKLIAFSFSGGSSSSGWPSIWVKQVSGGDPFQITKDECVDWNPVWSSDREDIAFLSDRGGQYGIWSIPAFGGTPTLLKELGSDYVGLRHWSKDRKKIYYDFRSNLFELDLESKITTQKTDFSTSKTPIIYYAISPDENSFAYTDSTNSKDSKDGRQVDVWVMPMRGGVRVRVTNDPFEDRLPVWHPDGKSIMYQSDRGGVNRIYIAYLDGRNPIPITVEDGDHTVTDISRDGTALDLKGIDEANISKVEVESGKESEVTSEIGLKLWPEVSPDGRRVAFHSTSALWKVKNSSIMAKPITSGGKQTQLVADGFNIKWSPDGSKIAFMRFSVDKGDNDIFTDKAFGGDEKKLTTGKVLSGYFTELPSNRGQPADYSWSPDGSKIAYSSKKSGQSNIWTVAADGSAENEITNNADTNLNISCPLWSPDGKRIAYVSETKTPLADGKKICSIWIAEEGKTKKIFQAKSFLRLIGWSEFGNELIIGLVDGNSYIPDATADVRLFEIGESKRPLTTLKSAYLFNIQLSPDKRTIAFVSDRDGADNLWVIPVDGGNERKITANTDRRMYFSSLTWSPDGKEIYYSKQTSGRMILTIKNFR